MSSDEKLDKILQALEMLLQQKTIEQQQKIESSSPTIQQIAEAKMTYPQKCPHCDLEWQSRVEKPVECPACKRSLRPKPIKDIAIATLDDPKLEDEECKRICGKFDAMIMKEGKVERLLNSSPKKKWVFSKMEDGSIHYEKFELEDFETKGVKFADRVIQSSYEILKDWAWRDFFFNRAYGKSLQELLEK